MILMSEKRLKFTLESDRQYIGIFNEGCAMTGFEVCNFLNSLYQQCEALQEENEQLRRDKNFLQNERRLQEKGIFTLFDEVNKLNKEIENLKIDHRIMGEKLYIMSKDYIKDVGDDDEC